MMIVQRRSSGERHRNPRTIGKTMYIRKLVATAALAIAATTITLATAHGEAQLADTTLSATDGSVGYTTTLAADHSNALVTLASGKFVVTPDAVQVVADDGTVVGAIPTTLRVDAGRTLSVTPTLASDTELTLTPNGGPTSAALSSQSVPFMHQTGGGGAILAGAVVGCVVGVLIGIWFFLVGAIIGCAIGAAIGGFVGAVS
ncbi:hypothetical protein DFR76_107387 [Nocardia pseudobrasiliensis]|uniref:DUF8020 domain-containing protein n=2 Tax=Nocardia pseudobrasiliensis TaxID=45979 RepID=A0A370I2P1_9NOCA|nr:hypothetical protein DFR76_107387 [Nocardia pseudobrasiliensis]